MITEDYVSFEIAKLLKEKGFDEDITTYRDDFIQHGNIVIPLQECLSEDKIKTPTIQMTMKWLRECKQLYIMLDFERPNCIEYKIYEYECEKGVRVLLYFDYVESYEQASESAIKYCLENLIGDEN